MAVSNANLISEDKNRSLTGVMFQGLANSHERVQQARDETNKDLHELIEKLTKQKQALVDNNAKLNGRVINLEAERANSLKTHQAQKKIETDRLDKKNKEHSEKINELCTITTLYCRRSEEHRILNVHYTSCMRQRYSCRDGVITQQKCDEDHKAERERLKGRRCSIKISEQAGLATKSHHTCYREDGCVIS